MSILPGSARDLLPDATPEGPLGDDEFAQVTVVVRRNPAQPSDPADLSAVTAALPGGVQVLNQHAPSGRVQIAGPANTLAEFFGTKLGMVWDQQYGRHFRHRVGELTLPDALDGIVLAVLGLDDRPVAESHIRTAAAPSASYTPLQVAAAYQFPPDTDGTGQRIALIELGGGYADSDLEAYFDELGVKTPTVTDQLVDGAENDAGADPEGADAEVLLDIEVAGAVAPAAEIVVYFAPNTDAGFLDAVSDAIHADPAPTVISISWGQAEDAWTAQARAALDAALADAAPRGITVTVAAGDTGSSDDEPPNPHVDFPASSTHVVACGGTRLIIGEDDAIESETVWNDGGSGADAPDIEATGGGFSAYFPRPAWQSQISGPSVGSASGRAVPDVAGNADPDTGYVVRVDGEGTVVGGTSAVAPLWAGLIARLAQSLGTPLGQFTPTIYPLQGQPAFHDITDGDNGAFAAAVGWDACTGLGTPDGTALLAALGNTRTAGS